MRVIQVGVAVRDQAAACADAVPVAEIREKGQGAVLLAFA